VVVTRSRGSVAAEMTPGGPELILQPRIVAKIFQVACPAPLDEPGMMEQVSELLEQKVQADLEAALERAGGLGADIFGFGLALYRSDPKAFIQLAPRWGEEWPLLPVRIKVSATVISSGSITHPARVHHEGE
ncbi:MAG: Ger(x)C family spore germination C-terminal domain-containing protein, partial [Firmicutes bacterium]|nr:Ger(x)C family spore germination C-terminal domain-containing protein [Bacillota bacterium]